MPDREDIDAFVVKNADYYSEKWQAFHNTSDSVTSFNKAAFFTAGIWLIYRKLYVPLLWLVVVLIVDVSLSIYLEDSGIASAGLIALWDRFSPLIYGGVIGTFGNYWYWRKFQRMEEQARTQSPDPAIQLHYLQSKGGTNAIGVWLVITILVALILVAIFYG